MRSRTAITRNPSNVATYPQPFKGFGSNAAANRQCHAISQAQHIDWQTNQVEAGLELRLDCDTAVEYSHLVRAFEQNDQQVNNLYRSGVGLGFTITDRRHDL